MLQLFRHLSQCHEERYASYLQAKEKASSNNAAEPGQASMDTFVSHGANGAKYGSLNPRQKLLSESLINNLIVNCSLPVSLVDNSN